MAKTLSHEEALRKMIKILLTTPKIRAMSDTIECPELPTTEEFDNYLEQNEKMLKVMELEFIKQDVDKIIILNRKTSNFFQKEIQNNVAVWVLC